MYRRRRFGTRCGGREETLEGLIKVVERLEKRPILASGFQQHTFLPPSELQLGTNLVLEGVRRKLRHKAISGALTKVPVNNLDSACGTIPQKREIEIN